MGNISNVTLTLAIKTRAIGKVMPETLYCSRHCQQESDVYQTLINHDAVVEVHALYGEYDLLVRLSSENSASLSGMLMSDFRQIDGVRHSNNDSGRILGEIIAIGFVLITTEPGQEKMVRGRLERLN